MDKEDSVYNSIEQAILDHRLAPGTRLQELKLSKIYDVKRGLVRKVLSRLSHAKLVEQKVNQGAQVASPSLKEAKDLFATRLILETAVVQHLCKNITSQHITALKRYILKENQAYLDGRIEQAKKISANFHLELAKLTNNGILIEYLRDIINRTPLIMLSHSESQDSCVNHDHLSIVDALSRHEEEKSITLLTDHIHQLSRSIKDNKIMPSNDIAQVLKR